ncbi:MAG: TolC family protein [Candidatus Aerophobetes bacterium]|nr:TolC family protein [Candidatus Aerophobetes bacterium]
MRKGFCLGILLVFTLAVPGFAQEKVVLTLEESIQRALEHSLDAQIVRTEMETAQLELDKQEATFKPQVSVSASPLQWKGDPELLEYRPGVNLDATLHTPGGTGITVSAAEEKEENEKMEARFTLGITQQVTSGPQYDSSSISLEKSRLGLEQEKLTSEEEIEGVKLEVMATFYGILRQERERELRELSLQQAEENLRIVEDKREEGMANQLDVLDAEMQRIEAEEALFQAKSNLLQSMIDLKELVGINLKEEIVLENKSSTEYHSLTIELEEALRQALENNLQISQQELAVKMCQLDCTVSKAEALPSLNVFADYSYNESGLEEEEYRVGMLVEIPLLDGGEGKTNIRIAEQKVKKAKLNLEKLKQDVCGMVREYFYELKGMEKRVTSLKLSQEKKRRALRIIEEMLSEGAATTQEMREWKISFIQTEIDYLQALVDYKVVKAELLKSIGRRIL